MSALTEDTAEQTSQRETKPVVSQQKTGIRTAAAKVSFNPKAARRIHGMTMDFSQFRDSGELSDCVVSVDGKEFKLHKFPLYIKSDFFRALARSNLTEKDKIELNDFPGGPDTFEQVANYCYNMKIDISKVSVCRIRCAAEYLQMTSPGNLIDMSERYLSDILNSAKLARSVGLIIDLLCDCSDLGPIAEQAHIVDRCIHAIVDCWLITSKYSRLQHDSRPDSDLQRLNDIPMNWFHRLFTVAKEKAVRPSVLANIVQMYITTAIDKGTLQPDVVKAQQKQVDDKNAAASSSSEDDDEEDEDSDLESEENEDSSETANSDKKGSDQEENSKDKDGEDQTKNENSNNCESTAADNSTQPSESKEEKPKKKKKKSQPKKEEKSQTLEQLDLEKDPGAVLDALLCELPENALIADTISPQWVASMLTTARQMGCKSRGMLLKLAARTFHRLSPDELAELPPDLLVEIVEQSTKDSTQDKHGYLVVKVVDQYLKDLAQKKTLTVDVFLKLVEVVPDEFRTSHDLLYEALELLLKSDKINISDEERQSLLEAVRFDKLNEDTLRAAYENEVVPVSYVTKAALNLCARLRSELESSRAVIRTQEDELQGVRRWAEPRLPPPPAYSYVPHVPATPYSAYTSTMMQPKRYRPTADLSDLELKMQLDEAMYDYQSPYDYSRYVPESGSGDMGDLDAPGTDIHRRSHWSNTYSGRH